MKNKKGKIICVVLGLSVAATVGLLHEANNADSTLLKLISGDSSIINMTDPISKDSKWSYIIIGDDKVAVAKYLETDSKLVIPSEIDGYKVVSIHFNYIDGSNTIESIEIPDSVSAINLAAFSNFTNLKNIEIPDSVTSIDESAFSLCTSLKNIKLPNELTEISKKLFLNCTSLINVQMPNNITKIGEYAFYGCSSLKSIEIPDGVTTIDEQAFSNCSSLKSIKIPKSVTSIGSGISDAGECVFQGTAKNFTIYCYENSYAHEYAVRHGINYKLIDAVENFEYKLNEDNNTVTILKYLGSAEEIEIPKTLASYPVTGIGEYALKNISAKKVKILDNIENIDEKAFEANTDIVIACYKDSAIEEYAKKHGIKYEYLITSISVKTEPNKPIYANREANYEGLVITCKDDKGNTFDVTEGFEVSPKIFKQAGNKQATVEYLGEQTTFTVDVQELVLENISIVQAPSKVEYVERDVFYSDGMIVKAKFNNGEEKIIDTYEITDTDKNELTRWKEYVTISYTDVDSGITKETTQKITVKPKAVSKIAIVANQRRSIYSKNESELDLKGGKIEVSYTDNDKETMAFDAIGVTASEMQKGVVGKQEITLTFGEQSTTFQITVIPSNIEYREANGKLEVISIKQEENIKRVEIPEIINEKEVTSIAQDAIIDAKEVNSIYIPATIKNIPENLFDENENVTVECEAGSYAEKYAKEHNMYYELIEKEIESISIGKEIIRTNYTTNEKLDLDKEELILNYKDETSSRISLRKYGVEVSGFNSTQVGSKTLNVTYKQKATSYLVDVSKDKITYKENATNDGIIITDVKITDGSTKVVIPATLEEKPVRELAANSISNIGIVNTVYIPSSVTKISEYLFNANNELTIECEEGSYAENFAKVNNINYELVNKTIKSISVGVVPTKTVYNIGETLDLTNGKIVLTYDDDTTSSISMKKLGVNAQNFNNQKGGTQGITLTYKGNATTYDVNVALELKEIEITKEPNKKLYIFGEAFDSTGMIVTAKYNDNSTKVVSGYTIVDTDKDNMIPGKTTITVSYTEGGITKTAIQKIVVKVKRVAKIEVEKMPNKVIYTKDYEQLELDGGEIKVQYEDGYESVIDIQSEGVFVSKLDNSKAGSQELIVSYDGKTTTFSVDVTKDKIAYEKNEQGTSAIITKIEDVGDKEIEIPTKLGGVLVTEIKAGAISNIANVKTIYIPSTVTKISAGLLNGNNGATIECETGSAAAEYAKNNNTYYELVDATVEDILINKEPTKKQYNIGEALDLNGGEISIVYTNGNKGLISMSREGITAVGFDNTKSGTQEVRLTYKGQTTKYSAEVIKKITEIVITTLPTKTAYNEGEAFDKTGMVVTAKYDDNTTQAITKYTILDTDISSLTAGKTAITVSYTEDGITKTVTVPVTVKEKEKPKPEEPNPENPDPEVKKVTEIVITTQPTKTAYKEGEAFDTTGMVVTVKYDDSTTKAITKYDILDTDAGSLIGGKTAITISYTENGITKTVQVPITVESNQASIPTQPNPGQDQPVTTLPVTTLPVTTLPVDSQYPHAGIFGKNILDSLMAVVSAAVAGLVGLIFGNRKKKK